jgi:glutamyl-tRNA reductase
VLNTLFNKAIHIGKKIRTESDIDSHPTSVGHAAVDFAVEEIGVLENKNIMVIGAGEMSAITVRCLFQHGAKTVIVSNRSYDRAVQLADEFGARAIGFDQMFQELQSADLVVCCTGAAHYVLTYGRYSPALAERKGKKIVLIDISVPRNIDPEIGTMPGVSLYDIDNLQQVVDENFAEREKAAGLAELMLQTELSSYKHWLQGMHVIPIITALKERGENIKQKELKKAFNKLGTMTEREQNIITTLAHGIVNQMLHDPIVNLKGLAADNQGPVYVEMVKNLYDLSINAGEYEQHDQAEVRHQR